MRDEDHSDVQPAAPVTQAPRALAEYACTIARCARVDWRTLPQYVLLASLPWRGVPCPTATAAVCSDIAFNRLTGSIPPQISSLNQLTFLCARPCLLPARPCCCGGVAAWECSSALCVAALSLVCGVGARADEGRWCTAHSMTTA